jgi:hypothetical protein
MKAYTITTRSDLYPEAKPVTRCGTFQPVENEHPIWTAIKEHFGTHLSRNLGKSDIGDIMSDLIHDPDATEYGFCTEGGECGIEIEDDPNATLQAIKERIQTIDVSGSNNCPRVPAHQKTQILRPIRVRRKRPTHPLLQTTKTRRFQTPHRPRKLLRRTSQIRQPQKPMLQ